MKRLPSIVVATCVAIVLASTQAAHTGVLIWREGRTRRLQLVEGHLTPPSLRHSAPQRDPGHVHLACSFPGPRNVSLVCTLSPQWTALDCLNKDELINEIHSILMPRAVSGSSWTLALDGERIPDRCEASDGSLWLSHPASASPASWLVVDRRSGNAAQPAPTPPARPPHAHSAWSFVQLEGESRVLAEGIPGPDARHYLGRVAPFVHDLLYHAELPGAAVSTAPGMVGFRSAVPRGASDDVLRRAAWDMAGRVVADHVSAMIELANTQGDVVAKHTEAHVADVISHAHPQLAPALGHHLVSVLPSPVGDQIARAVDGALDEQLRHLQTMERGLGGANATESADQARKRAAHPYCPASAVAFPTYQPGRISWLHREVNQGGAFLLGHLGHVAGPAQPRRRIIVYGVESGADMDTIWLDPAWKPWASFEVGEIVLLRGFARQGNQGLFRIVEKPARNILRLGELVPHAVREGRLSWLEPEQNVNGATIQLCHGGQIGPASSNLQMIVDPLHRSIHVKPQLPNPVPAGEFVMLRGFAFPGNTGSFQVASSEADTLVLRDPAPCQAGRLSWLHPELNMDGALLRSAGTSTSPASPSVPIRLTPRCGGLGFVCVEQMQLSAPPTGLPGAQVGRTKLPFFAGEIVHLLDFSEPGNFGAFRVERVNSTSILLGEVNSDKDVQCLDSPRASKEDLIPPIIDVEAAIEDARRTIARVRDVASFRRRLQHPRRHHANVTHRAPASPPAPTPPGECEPTLAGPNCTRTVLPCPFDCTGNGHCESESGRCDCEPTWTGLACDRRVLPCPMDCGGHGTCSPVTGKCDCEPTWGGVACETRVLPCPGNCSGTHGRCDFRVGKCICEPTWSGVDCRATALPCPRQCSGHGECDQSTGRCDCQLGYGGLDCSEDIDKHCPNNCVSSAHGVCDKRTHRCVCHRAWTGIDCSVPKCGPHGAMTSDGSCECDYGYFPREPGAVCDLDPSGCPCAIECRADRSVLDTCNKRGTGCTAGGKCTCRASWAGEHCEVPIIITGELNQHNFPTSLTRDRFPDEPMRLCKAFFVLATGCRNLGSHSLGVTVDDIFCVLNLTGYPTDSREEQQSMQQAFMRFDPRGSGTVLFSDFVRACGDPDEILLSRILKLAYAHLDHTKDGRITREDAEFAYRARIQAEALLSDAQIRVDTFRRLDRVYRALGTRLAMAGAGPQGWSCSGSTAAEMSSKVDEFMRSCDANMDGSIYYDEFAVCVTQFPWLAAPMDPLNCLVEEVDEGAIRWCQTFPEPAGAPTGLCSGQSELMRDQQATMREMDSRAGGGGGQGGEGGGRRGGTQGRHGDVSVGHPSKDGRGQPEDGSPGKHGSTPDDNWRDYGPRGDDPVAMAPENQGGPGGPGGRDLEPQQNAPGLRPQESPRARRRRPSPGGSSSVGDKVETLDANAPPGSLGEEPMGSFPPGAGPFTIPSPYAWCDMSDPYELAPPALPAPPAPPPTLISPCSVPPRFSNPFCPTPNPQFNILIKMMIPSVIRPVIDMWLAKFLQGHHAVNELMECMFPASDASGPRAGPAFIELAEGSEPARPPASREAARLRRLCRVAPTVSAASVGPVSQPHRDGAAADSPVLLQVASLLRGEAKSAGRGASRAGSSEETAGEAEAGSTVGAHVGTLVPELKKALYELNVHPMASSIANLLDYRVSKPLVASLQGRLLESLQPPLGASILHGLIHLAPSAVILIATKAVPQMLHKIVPTFLFHSLTGTLTALLTRSLSHSLGPAILSTAGRSPQDLFWCYHCQHSQKHCVKCQANGMLQAERAMYHMTYYTDYFSDYYADYYSKHYAMFLDT